MVQPARGWSHIQWATSKRLRLTDAGSSWVQLQANAAQVLWRLSRPNKGQSAAFVTNLAWQHGLLTADSCILGSSRPHAQVRGKPWRSRFLPERGCLVCQ